MDAELPDDALLARYQPPHYTDCFSVTVPRDVSLEAFVYAFYTAPLFRCERVILKLIGRSSTVADALRLVQQDQDRFAAWSVEDRATDQLLMCDFQSRTRSWFMVLPEQSATTLYFGSAVIADKQSDGPPTTYRVLLRLHRLYSRLLLRGAVRRLARGPALPQRPA